MKYCVYCGNELLDEAVMCPKCGKFVEESGIRVVDQVKQTPNKLVKTANVFIIIGCILTGIAAYLIGFVWTIPITCVYFAKRKKGKEISVGFKICILILVSQIGGILLLCDHN